MFRVKNRTRNFAARLFCLFLLEQLPGCSMAFGGNRTMQSFPKAVIFDLDGSLWDPEMDQLNQLFGGAPFTQNKDGSVSDKMGTRVHLIGDVKNILHELKTDPKWSKTLVCVASSNKKPNWARECIDKIDIGGGFKMKDVFNKSCTEIYKGSKNKHFNEIQRKTGIDFKDMIFFDDRVDICRTVAKLGMTVVYTLCGITREAWNLGIDNFPAPGCLCVSAGSRNLATFGPTVLKFCALFVFLIFMT